MNYGELKSQFQGLLNRRDVTPSQVAIFIDQSITRCQRELRLPLMEKVITVTIDDSYDGIAIPADFLELISIENSDGFEMERRTLQEVKRLAASGNLGKPRVYMRQGSKWYFGPKPQVDDTITIAYYAEFDALSADSDTNKLTISAPDLAMYGALSYACDFFIDDRAATFEGRFQAIKVELNNQKNMDELSGNATVRPAYDYEDDC
jgi:hypothetical protein